MSERTLERVVKAACPHDCPDTCAMRVIVARFFNALGASELVRTICAGAGAAGVHATHGASPEIDPERWPNARYVLCWGWNPMSTAPHLRRFILEARRAGARLVVVDPFRSRTARVADEHVRPLPGTDRVLALGMMRAIVDAGLHDEAWCRAHATSCSRAWTTTRWSGAPRRARCPPRRSRRSGARSRPRSRRCCASASARSVQSARRYSTIAMPSFSSAYGPSATVQPLRS